MTGVDRNYKTTTDYTYKSGGDDSEELNKGVKEIESRCDNSDI